MVYVLFVAGFIILIFGANWLVDGSAALARKFGIPDIVIGLTIVSIGTSAPELIVSSIAAIKQNTDIAISNVLGSNIFNVFLIIGITAVIYPVKVGNNTTWKEIPFSLFAAIALGIAALDKWLYYGDTNTLGRIDGIIFLFLFAVFMYYSFSLSRNAKPGSSPTEAATLPLWRSALFIVLGLAGLIIGGRWIVDGSSNVAALFGLRESVVGLTIVATATSLPELVTSIVAARKKNTDIAIGNAIGSSIFNIFLVLGISAVIFPLPFDVFLRWDLAMAMFANIVLFIFVIVGRQKSTITRVEGIGMIMIYFIYIIYSVTAN